MKQAVWQLAWDMFFEDYNRSRLDHGYPAVTRNRMYRDPDIDAHVWRRWSRVVGAYMTLARRKARGEDLDLVSQD